MRTAAKIDSNQNGIVKSLRQVPGVSVFITSQIGKGFVDIICGYKKTNYLIELKDGNKVPSKRKLTPDEETFHKDWEGQISVAESLEDVLKIIGVKV
jgi:hypothetical protein